MVELADSDAMLSPSVADEPPLFSEDHLAERCMFLKEFDPLDIDHGHFWYKVSWHGVHVEFPSRLHHYEPNLYERQIRDYLVALPADVLEERNRQFPSKRLSAELELLKAQRAKAQQAVEAWDRLILHCQERMAQDEILHLGHATHVAR
jgi:hypothetical protein